MNNKSLVEQLQKNLKDKDEFFCIIGHEIKNYIHASYFTIDYLQQDYDKIDDETRKQLISTISKSVDSLRYLTNDLVDFAKFNSGQLDFDFHDIDFLQIINKVIEYSRTTFLVNKNLLIIFENDELDKAIVFGNSMRIEQLLMNLFINAIKYSHNGTVILTLSLTDINDINYWQFAISDQGIGIPIDELKYVVDPFFRSSTSKNLTSGSGLGLAISKKIVEAHNGKIEVRNNIDKGTTFIFILPVLKK